MVRRGIGDYPDEPTEALYHLDRIPLTVEGDERGNCIQCVEDKMRIDLQTKRHQLSFIGPIFRHGTRPAQSQCGDTDDDF